MSSTGLTSAPDVLIRGGTIFDGSGADGVVADLLISDGRVKAMGIDLEVGSDAEVIDADGCWVTPGFIDLHTHYDAELELDPSLSESVRHGVTTTLIGSCGLSFAVGDPDDLADMFCRVEGVPRAEVLPLLEQIQDWDSPKGYMEHLSRLPLGPNVVSFLGHSAIRAHVMGLERSLTDGEEPTSSEIQRMESMLSEALDVGYLGLSVNTLPWDKMDGERFRSRPTPSVFAKWSEYRKLARILRERGAIFQGVPDVSGRWNVFLFVGLASGLRRKPLKTTIISLMDIRSAPGVYRLLGGMASAARKFLRADVRFQSLPQPFRMWTDGLENPIIEEFGAGTQALHLASSARPELLNDPEYRAKFRRQWTNRFKGRAFHRDLHEANIVGCPDNSMIGLTFAEVGERRGVDPLDAFLDLQSEFGNDLRWQTTLGNTNPDSVAWIVSHPQAIIGFSDAGAHLRNMAFYNFPLHMLRLVKQLAANGNSPLTLGEAVHRLTGEIADYLEIEAGRLRIGDRADVAIIDPRGLDESVDVVTEEPMPGLPGLNRLVNRNDSAVRCVLVNGRLAWNDNSVASGFGNSAGFGSLLRWKGSR